MDINEEIVNLKQELLDKYSISMDRDLIKQLGISNENKSKLFLWIRYQCAFSYREGYKNGNLEYIENELNKSTSDRKLNKEVLTKLGFVNLNRK